MGYLERLFALQCFLFFFFFSPFLVLFLFGRWGFRSLLTPERLITIHMSHTPHIIRVRETELEYSKGLQGVSSQEKEGKVCLFFFFCKKGGEKRGEEGGEKNVHVFMCQCMWHVRSGGVCKGEVGALRAEGEAMERVRKI